MYVGITNNLLRRVGEHKSGLVEGFTNKYNVHKLLYFEHYNDVNEAIKREKQIKNLVRRKKVELIELKNPAFEDLYSKLLKEFMM